MSFTITVTAEELETLRALVDAGNNGRAKDFNGNEISVSHELLEDAQEWGILAAGGCPFCTAANGELQVHPVNEDGTCGLTEENAAEHGYC